MFKKGFSLVEIAVVVLIISFIFIAIISAQRLQGIIYMRGIMQEFNKLEMAITHFSNSYNYLPGDFPKASKHFGSTVANDGNGNGVFDINPNSEAEISNAADHLYASGAFKELQKIDDASFRSEISKTGTYKFTEHCTSITNGLFDSRDHIFSVTLFNPNGGATWTPVVSAYEAYNIDQKLDDGAAQTGKIIGFVASADNSTYNCLSNNVSICSENPTSADYVQSNKNLGCAISMGINAIIQR